MRNRGEKGSALVMALVLIVVMIGVVVSYSQSVMVDTQEAVATCDAIKAESIALAGLNFVLLEMKMGKDLDGDADINHDGAVNTQDDLDGDGIEEEGIGSLGRYKIATGIPTTKDFAGATLSTAQNKTFYKYDFDGGIVDAHVVKADAVDPKDSWTGGTAAPTTPDTYLIRSTAVYNGVTKRYEAVISKHAGGIYWYAIFAGNSGGSTSYTMKFNGTSTSGDNVVGAVYSGNNVLIQQNAKIRNAIAADPNYVPGQNDPIGGNVRATGTITTTATGIQGAVSHGTEEIPDLTSYNYAQSAQEAFENPTGDMALKFVDVAREIAANGTLAHWTDGDSTSSAKAYQITDQGNPAHIFRKNPSDRATLNDSTVGVDDYYLEDPTANGNEHNAGSGSDYKLNGSGNNATHIKITKDVSNPRRDGTGKVYFVDGNVWVNNKTTYSFVMKHSEANGIKITIVAKGNIYIGDNLFYNNQNKDGLALIALKRDGDTTGATGNVLLGDPLYGTTHAIEAFMYAENNFIDNNLDAAGSKSFYISGNMTAGNQVAIQRDYKVGSTWKHSKMDVYFDARIRDDEDFREGMPVIPLPVGTEASFDTLYINPVPAPRGILAPYYVSSPSACDGIGFLTGYDRVIRTETSTYGELAMPKE
jgi:hypothetical protein